MTHTNTDTTYNGWSSFETWSASLWINNEEPLYRMARNYARQCERLNEVVNWDDLAEVIVMNFGKKNGDGVAWTDPNIDTDEMNEMIRELTE